VRAESVSSGGVRNFFFVTNGATSNGGSPFECIRLLAVLGELAWLGNRQFLIVATFNLTGVQAAAC